MDIFVKRLKCNLVEITLFHWRVLFSKMLAILYKHLSSMHVPLFVARLRNIWNTVYLFTHRETNRFNLAVTVAPQNKMSFNLTYQELLKRTHGIYEQVCLMKVTVCNMIRNNSVKLLMHLNLSFKCYSTRNVCRQFENKFTVPKFVPPHQICMHRRNAAYGLTKFLFLLKNMYSLS